jgi:F0F1-type ATP synthase epsilon subunit
MDETPTPPRKRLCEIVAASVQNQRDMQADEINAAADEAPAFDKRSGTSNAGRRLSAAIQRALAQ